MSKTILVPVDGSEHSRKALDFACELASALDGKLHLLHVAQPMIENRTLVLGAAAVTMHATPKELEEAGHKVIEAAKAVAAEQGCKQVETEVTGGDPARSIVEAASSIGADMIVMGTRGLTDLGGLVMGSVSHKVSHLAPCTCVSVR